MARTHWLFLSLFVCVSVVLHAQDNSKNYEKITAAYMQRLIQQKSLATLTLFCKALPKGGDLHHHYSGSLYVEDMIDIAKEASMFLDTLTFRVSKNPSNGIPISHLYRDSKRFEKLISLWSVENYDKYNNPPIPSYDHFFSTFGQFPNEVLDSHIALLRKLKKRALDENVQYIETMLFPSASIIKTPINESKYDSILAVCLKTKNEDLAKRTFEEIYTLAMQDNNRAFREQRIKQELDFFKGLADSINDDNFDLRSQFYIFRNNAQHSKVFISALSNFFVSSQLPTYAVGVNIVGPEHQQQALLNYWIQMQMFSFLKKKFPTVKTSMHAGELRLGLVTPEEMSDHISQAVFTAHADRIGHGVDIAHEKDAMGILAYMKEQKKAIEINLTSNDFILGVKGDLHPLPLYLSQGVPVVICTDDAGVLRSHLTEQFVRLANEHQIDYLTMKSLIFNSITYSFLDATTKSKQINLLKKKFDAFEREIAKRAN